MIKSKALAPAIVVSVLVTAFSSAGAADNPARQIDELTTQWTTLQHQQDVLTSNWRLEKPVLEQQLDLLERESKGLSEVFEQSSKQQGQVEQRRLELLQQQTQLEQEQAATQSSLGRITAALHGLYPQLPPPLVLAWNQTLPKLDEPTRTASDKLQIALELLSKLSDFQQKLTLNETVMPLKDGQDYLVKQVYLGLSHGWYVTADLKHAAMGRADVNGWQWTDTDEAAAIAHMIGILERKQSPELVSLPATLTKAAP